MRRALLTTHPFPGACTAYRATASETYKVQIATVPVGTVAYQAPGLQSGTTYFFVATTFDSAGNEGMRSNEVSKSIF